MLTPCGLRAYLQVVALNPSGVCSRCIADSVPQALDEELLLTLSNFSKAIVKRLENMSLGTRRKVRFYNPAHSKPCGAAYVWSTVVVIKRMPVGINFLAAFACLQKALCAQCMRVTGAAER